MNRTRTAFVRLMIVAALGAGLIVPPAAAQECSDRVDGDVFPSEARMREWNEVMAGLDPRPTASRGHERFISWLEGRLDEIPGLEISTLDETLDRSLERGASLAIRGRRGRDRVPVAAAVPYSKATSVSAPLAYVPPEQPIEEADVEGKIVLRDFVPGVIQQAVFFAVAYYVHDPEASFDYAGDYERDWVGAGQVIADLEQAGESGAAGLVFVHELPREQVAGDYFPYNGIFWGVPAVYVGVDEGEQLKQAEGSVADLTVRAQRTPGAPTRNVIASLPGQSDERIVISSHTDGVNAVWDNGPIGILALAEYFASLPLECRPRTIEFVFTTAHLYLSQVGADRYAALLDEAYDDGTVAFVVVLEHLGALEWVAVPRGPDLPGRRLEATGESEMFAVFVHESPATLQAVTRSVIERDLRRTWVLRGADAPEVRFPPHHSYGGEGGPYHQHLIPTVAAITGPATLFKPIFEMDEILDVELMRRQTMAFGDVIVQLRDVSREIIAGADTLYRMGRDATSGSE